MEELKWMKEKRNILKLTLRQVEKATGISNAYLSQLESGKIKNPGFTTVIKLTSFYNSFKDEPKKVKCPCCRSENISTKEIHQHKDSMTIIMGQIIRPIALFRYNLCNDCGIMFQKITK